MTIERRGDGYAEVPCPQCGGDGYEVGMEHDCGGDDRLCASRCPIPVQVACGACGGLGELEL